MSGHWGQPLRTPLVRRRAGCPTLPETAGAESASHFEARLRDALSAHGLFGKPGATLRPNSGMYFPVEASGKLCPFWTLIAGCAFHSWSAQLLRTVPSCRQERSVPKCRVETKAPQSERTAGLMKRGKFVGALPGAHKRYNRVETTRECGYQRGRPWSRRPCPERR